MKEYLGLFASFFKIGLFTIGGGMAMLPLIQHMVVDRKKWMTEGEMTDCIAVSQALPGVIAINAATYIGKKRRGLGGAFSASLGVVMPSFIIIILAVLLLGALGPNQYVEGAFTAVKASSAGLILYAGFRLSRQVIRRKLDWIIALGSFAIVTFLNLTAFWPILAAGIIGFVAGRIKK